MKAIYSYVLKTDDGAAPNPDAKYRAGVILYS